MVKKKKRVKHCLYSSTGKSQGLITKAGEVLVIIPMQSSHLSSDYKAFFFFFFFYSGLIEMRIV